MKSGDITGVTGVPELTWCYNRNTYDIYIMYIDLAYAVLFLNTLVDTTSLYISVCPNPYGLSYIVHLAHLASSLLSLGSLA